jgi:hypothetical protein
MNNLVSIVHILSVYDQDIIVYTVPCRTPVCVFIELL